MTPDIPRVRALRWPSGSPDVAAIMRAANDTDSPVPRRYAHPPPRSAAALARLAIQRRLEPRWRQVGPIPRRRRSQPHVEIGGSIRA